MHASNVLGFWTGISTGSTSFAIFENIFHRCSQSEGNVTITIVMVSVWYANYNTRGRAFPFFGTCPATTELFDQWKQPESKRERERGRKRYVRSRDSIDRNRPFHFSSDESARDSRDARSVGFCEISTARICIRRRKVRFPSFVSRSGEKRRKRARNSCTGPRKRWNSSGTRMFTNRSSFRSQALTQSF